VRKSTWGDTYLDFTGSTSLTSLTGSSAIRHADALAGDGAVSRTDDKVRNCTPSAGRVATKQLLAQANALVRLYGTKERQV
jgi:hypothetical protein